MDDVFAQRFRVALVVSEKSQRDIAAACEVSPQAVHKWCSGNGHPSSKHLMKICSETGASLDWLMDGSKVDIRSTEYAPGGVHIKTRIREVLAEMSLS